MHLQNSLRLRGYWAGFAAWLVLTFAIPMSSAAVTDAGGWLRLCSAQGAHWVQVDDDTHNTSSGDLTPCPCLGQSPIADAPEMVAALSANKPEAVSVTGLTERIFRPAYQPRSPPRISS